MELDIAALSIAARKAGTGKTVDVKHRLSMVMDDRAEPPVLCCPRSLISIHSPNSTHMHSGRTQNYIVVCKPMSNRQTYGDASWQARPGGARSRGYPVRSRGKEATNDFISVDKIKVAGTGG